MTDRHAKLKIKTLTLAKLKPHPQNPRHHPEPGSPEWDTLKKSLEHDYFDPLVWNQRNGCLVSGHLRTKVMEELGVKKADVVVVDYDEPTHVARMIAANRQVGIDNEVAIEEFLRDGLVNKQALMMSDNEIQEILESVQKPASEAAQAAAVSKWEVIVECRSEEEQRELYESLTQKGKTCKLLTF